MPKITPLAPPDDDPVLSVTDAATYLKVGRSTVYRLVADGRLGYVKIYRRTMFRRSDLDAFLATSVRYMAPRRRPA